MSGLSRRRLMTSLAYYVGAAPVADAKVGLSHSPQAAPPYTSVRDFGAKGNGIADDTRAIHAAIAAAPVGGTVWFPPGTYMVGKTLELRPGTTYLGSNPESSVIRQRDGANLDAILADENFIMNLHHTSSGVQVENLGIDGNSGRNRRGHGLVLMTDRCLVRHVIVSFTPEAGIVLSDQNSNGIVVSDNAVENRIEDCTIIQPGSYGVWIRDTHSSGRQTDGYLLNNVVKDSQGAWAMRIERAAGWFIANNHVYHCAAGGIYLSHVAGTYFYTNEVDKFGLTESPPSSYRGIQAQFLMGRFRPSIFMGNVCATPEGLFPRNLYTYYELGADQYGQSSLVFIGNVAHNDPIGEPPKTHQAYESTAFTYTTQPGGTLDVSKAANTNVGALTSEFVPHGADVQFGSALPHTPITTPLAAGVAGGAVVGGIGLAARSRRTREHATKLFGSVRSAGQDAKKELRTRIEVTETLSRWEIDPLNFAPEVGSIHLTYFVPFQQADVTQITSATGNRPAVNAAVSRVGVYEVLETGELNLLGATSNYAGKLWAAPHSVTTVDLDPRFGPVPLPLVAGKHYAYAEIQKGGSPAARVGKVGNPALMALDPRGSAKYRGYGDLPPSLPAPSEVNASGLQLYARLSGAQRPGSERHRNRSLTGGPADPPLEPDYS